MAVKQRNKNVGGDRNSSPSPDDVAKKSPKSGDRGTADAPASGSGGSVGFLATAGYLLLVAAVGFAAFRLQRVREEVVEIGHRSEVSSLRSSELNAKMDALRQQVDAAKETVSGFDSALSDMRTELNNVGRLQRRGEEETRRVEEALQRLQKEILKDLSDGIQEVKQTRQQDFSSLERTVDERLAELSGSIGESVAGVAEVQTETQSQLQDLQARLESLPDTAQLREQLQGVVASVAELQAAATAAGKTTDSLSEQINAVGAELQTRNQEVASQSEEIGSVRAMVQSTTGALRESLSAVEVTVQALSDHTQNLRSGIERGEGGLQSLEKEVRRVTDRSERNIEDVQARLKALEDNADAILAFVAEQVSKLESRLSKYDSQDSALAALAKDADSDRANAQRDVRELQTSLREVNSTQQSLENVLAEHKDHVEELQAAVRGLGSAQTELLSGLSGHTQQIQDLEQRVAVFGDSGSPVSEVKASVSQIESDLQQLRTAVDSLVAHSVKVEQHQEAIASLRRDLDQTQAALEVLSRSPQSLEEEK
ncbi:hypothetical protein GN956_G12010 [Arapaima gigas]